MVISNWIMVIYICRFNIKCSYCQTRFICSDETRPHAQTNDSVMKQCINHLVDYKLLS